MHRRRPWPHRACVAGLAAGLMAFMRIATGAPSPSLDLSVGAFGIFDHVGDPTRLAVEYRGRARGGWGLVPAAGFALGPDNVRYFYAGLQHDFELGDRWWITPSVAVGVFDNGQALGVDSFAEFQTGLAVSHGFDGGWRMGLAMYHVSNGGLARPNAGTEAAALIFGIPLQPRATASP